MNDQTQRETERVRSEVIKIFILATTIAVGSSIAGLFFSENTIEISLAQFRALFGYYSSVTAETFSLQKEILYGFTLLKAVSTVLFVSSYFAIFSKTCELLLQSELSFRTLVEGGFFAMLRAMLIFLFIIYGLELLY